MAAYTLVNLKAGVEDMAPKFGLAPGMEARFARVPLELEKSGVSYFKLAPGYRQPFGHRHGEQEEVYVLLGGTGRLKVDEEILELAAFDAVRLPGETMRAMEAGPDGCEFLAFGAPNTDNKDAEPAPGWWSE